MSQDPKDPSLEKPMMPAGRGKKEVELFPGIVERNATSLAPAAISGGTKLGTQITMFSPMSFEEALDVVETLRTRAATTISLEKMRRVDAVRLVDFITGASAALDGDFHKLTDMVYVFTPANMRIVAPGKQVCGTAAAVAKPVTGPLDFLFPDGMSDKPTQTINWTKR